MKTIWESDGIDEPVLICCPPKVPATGLRPKKPQTDKPMALEMPAIEAKEPMLWLKDRLEQITKGGE